MKFCFKPAMRSYFQTVIIIAFSFISFLGNITIAQENKLLGTWILDYALDSEGGFSTVHSNMFSAEVTYTISKGNFKVNDSSQKANYDSFNNINLLDRTLYYRLDGDYLILQERGSPHEVFYLLKDSVFLKTYPEFASKYEERNGEKLLLQDAFKKAQFTSSLGFAETMSYFSPELKKKSKNEFYCEVEFVLDTNNKIRDVKFIPTLEKKMEEEFLKAMPKINDYYFNHTGENMLIKESINYGSMTNKKKNPDLEKLKDNFYEGNKLYRNNKPDEALKLFEEVKDIEINRNQHGGIFYDDYLKTMGICYLLVNKQEEACAVFHKLGTLSDFKARNFLRFFCSKNQDK